MRLTHHGYQPNAAPFSIPQPAEGHHKPRGLWVSDDDSYGWSEWCTDNECDFLGPYPYNVELDMSRILHLSSPEAVRQFTEEFHVVWPDDDLRLLDRFHIHWAAVAEKWAGILISPYMWPLRMDMSTFWYYTWDCASGCVWDVSAISSFRPRLAIEAGRPEAAK